MNLTLFSSLFGRISTDPAKKWGKKCSTGQGFIFTEVTSYKIYTLILDSEKMVFLSFFWAKICDLYLRQVF